MKIVIKILIGISFLLSVSACKDEMIDLNTNPELLTSTDPVFVFTSATKNWNNNSRGHLMGKYSGVMQLMQYIVSNGGGSDGIYASSSKPTNPAPYLPYYNDYYTQYGNKLQYLNDIVIENRIDKERYKNLAAISKILQVYEAWLVFDTHGAAPYKQALRALEGNNTPEYDYIEDLYKEFDQDVKDQVAVLMSNAPDQVELGNNDFFYRGDISKWIKFGNTLRIKMAQRFEKKDNTHYQSVISDVLANEGGIISSNDESCVYYHNIEYNNDTWDTAVLTYQYCASNAFVSFLKDNNDPRLSIMVRRNGFGPGNNNPANDNWADTLAKYVPDFETNPLYERQVERYVGMPASPDMKEDDLSDEYTNFSITEGVPSPVSFSIRAISQVQSRFFVKNGGNVETASGARNIDYPRTEDNDQIRLFTPQITYPEVCFMMAEIAEKAGADKGGKSAQTWYEDGIRASMKLYQEWGERMKVLSASEPTADDYSPIDDDVIDAYLAQPQIAYTGSSEHKLQLIVSQAWVNFFMRPEEAWATWKRTGYPVFKEEFADANPDNGVAFLEKPTSGGNELLIPRRSILPTPNTANVQNYDKAIDHLTSQPNYLEPNQSQGRVYWDVD